MFNTFRRLRTKETEASRLLKIAKTYDINARIKFIVDSEFRRLLYLAEKTALNGQTSFPFEIDINEKDMIYFNQIIHAFITRIHGDGFIYTRQLLSNQKQFTIHFGRPTETRKNIKENING